MAAYSVGWKNKMEKGLKSLPKSVQEGFFLLVEDLKAHGPMPKGWKNMGKLKDDSYHCHLSYSYVACWYNENNTITIEVNYVGSREGAPY